MRTETEQDARIERMENGDWLYRLLADVREEVADQPNAEAVKRIRARLLAEMKPAVRAAA